MKKKILIIALTGVVLISVGMTNGDISDSSIDIETKLELVETKRLKEEAIKDSINLYHQSELDKFLTEVGHRESTNRYDVVNRWGYMGKYQFGRSTLKGLGYNVSKKEFLSNHDLQEEAMMALLNHNKEKLQAYIDIFDGKTVNGIYITESGILAAAHLGGQGSVKRFFKNGRVFRDGNGTKITSYMEKFSGYDIALN